ncbi:DUF3093 domain-containing protein [Micrococcus flavus]|uniref:Uncharacterized protein n=1 Tax=Micrococcus flavus TaxID=384602 RepID=A0A4Y8X0I5_9MICC|nr:DUF3093 domain-containing protein [Micrococcus flavus]MBB4882524.1 hypothetical protein [Micrococcus flavus]TFI02107.1 DUF3093 domain-containing protein [Micrococcus flavus]GGK38126.1 hypothetical protein GCM10007073_00960 [Micrococcus flavus]
MHEETRTAEIRPDRPADGPHSPAGAGAVLFAERLSPSPGVWVVAAMLAGLTILVFAPIDVWLGVAAAIGFFVVEAIVLITSTPRIVVTDSSLQVGRAQIERRHVGEVTGHRGESARAQQGPLLHGWAYVTVRGWIAPVVRVQITDARDRTPYWLTSTRRPEELVAALGGRMADEAA